jgi:hypothetical protein
MLACHEGTTEDANDLLDRQRSTARYERWPRTRVAEEGEMSHLLGGQTIILISDRKCVDCGGQVPAFMIPDKVWDGLGFALADWSCLACVGRRLNPALKHPEDPFQRHRFHLEQSNSYNSGQMQMPLAESIIVLIPGEGSLKELTAEETGPCSKRRTDG